MEYKMGTECLKKAALLNSKRVRVFALVEWLFLIIVSGTCGSLMSVIQKYSNNPIGSKVSFSLWFVVFLFLSSFIAFIILTRGDRSQTVSFFCLQII